MRRMDFDEAVALLSTYSPDVLRGPSPSLEERIACEMPLGSYVGHEGGHDTYGFEFTSELLNHEDAMDMPIDVSRRRVDWSRDATCSICCHVKKSPQYEQTSCLSATGATPGVTDNKILTLSEVYAASSSREWDKLCRSPYRDFVIQNQCHTQDHTICRRCLYVWYFCFDRLDCDECRTATASATPTMSKNQAFDVGLVESVLEFFIHTDPQYRHARRQAMDRKQLQYKPDTEAQLLQILEQDPMNYELGTPCGKCGTLISHTTDCHTLCHCRTETCFVCGKTCHGKSHRDRKLMNNHWKTPETPGGCPRYPHDDFWNNVAGCGFKCVQGTRGCYDHDHSCTRLDHASGRQNYAFCIYQYRLHRLWVGLSTSVQKNFLIKHSLHPQVKQFQPRINACMDDISNWNVS